MTNFLGTKARYVFLLALASASAVWANGVYSLAPDSATVVAGNTVTFTASVSGNTQLSVSMNFTYDPDVLEFVSASWTAAANAVKNPITSNPIHTLALYRVSFVYQGTSVFNGDLGTMVFNVKANAPLGVNNDAITYFGGNQTSTSGLPISLTVVKLFNANDATLTVAEDAGWTAVDLTGKFTDQNGTPVAADVTGVTQPAHGESKLEDGTVYYRPSPNYNGADAFAYTADDGVNPTDDGSVTVTVTAVNDVPELRTTNIGNGWWYDYQENRGYVNPFTAVEIIDPDFSDPTPQANYNGAVFHALIENAQTDDELFYPDTPAGRSLPTVTVTGANVIYNDNGVVKTIGTLSGTATSLQVALNSAGITPAMIQVLVTDLLYQNSSNAPSSAERTIRVALDDAPSDRTISHHLFESAAFLVRNPDGTAFLNFELATDAAVYSVTLKGNNGATVGTLDQYGQMTGMNGVTGVTGAEGWYNYDTPDGDPGRAEWDGEIMFDTWAHLVAAFPAGVPPAAGLQLVLTYWDGSTSTLNLTTTGVPAAAPAVPAFSNGYPTTTATSITAQWASNTGAAAATVLRAEIEGPQIYNLDNDEFGTMKVGGVWPDTSTTFSGLSAGDYFVSLYTGAFVVDGVVSDVPAQVVWGALRETTVTVGTTFAVNGTITDTTGSRADGDDLVVDIQLVDGSGFWQYYDDIEGTFAAAGPWAYSAHLVAVPGGYNHYIVQAYIDRNHNGQADTGEPYGETANITATGTYNISLTTMARGWTRDWALLGDSYLFVTPVNDPPENTVAPSITGTLQYGQTATANTGSWNDNKDYTGAAPAITDFAYQWYSADDADGTNEAALGGETGSTLSLTGALVGKYISVKVTATDQGVGQLPDRANASTSAMSVRYEVSPAPITVTADAKSKVYGAADPALTYQITSGALVGGDALTGALARNAGEGVGTYAITQGTLAATANYALTYVGANLTITPKPITVAADNTGKTYGSGDPALTYQVTSGSLEDGDSFTGALSREAGEGVGTYTINQGTLSAGANYTITFNTGTFTIAPKALTVTADPQTKVYGDADPALTYQVTSGSLEDGDGFSGALSRVAGENVGAYNILQGTLTAGANYTITYVDDELAITRKAITVTADAQTKEYGDADPELTYQITAGALVGGDAFSGALTRDAGEDVAAYNILQGTLSAGGNYNLTYVGNQLTITKRAITVTADAQTKTYGDADPELTYQITVGSLLPGDVLTGELSRLAGEAAFTLYQIQQNTLTAGGNYTLTYVPANLYIARRLITVTADAKSKTYGDADPALTYQITSGNLVNGDTLTGALSRVAGENVGDYEIQQNTLAASDNYTLTYVPANLTISKKAITVTADAKSKTYGDADPALTYQRTSGTMVGEDTITGALTRVAGENAGDYEIQQGTVTAGGNYALTYVPADLTINPRPITVTADAKNKTYGDADPALTYQRTSGTMVGGDTITGDLTRVAGENVGDYQIQQGTVTAGGNYALTYVPANLTIGKAPLTVTADDKSRTYWQTNADDVTFSATFGELDTRAPVANGLVGGDTAEEFTLTLGTDANDGDPWSDTVPSPYHTTVTVENLTALPASNYTITTRTGSFTITKGSAPTRNAANSSSKPRLVVSGQTTDIDLNDYFDDADEGRGDALVFSNIGDAVSGAGDWTVDVADRGGVIVFDPKTTTEAGTGGGTPVDITFSVKVKDSANPALLLDGTADGVATIYLRLIDNQAPVVTVATPADADGNVGADDTEQIAISEGDSVQVSVTASDATDPSGDDGIASIHFAYSWDEEAWTNFDQAVRLGASSATSASLATDHNTVSFAEGSKVLYVKATITDGADVEAVKRWEFTIGNVNVPPTLDDIDDVTVQEDNAGDVTLEVTLTGVSNGGETNDPDITSVVDRPALSATITAVSNRTDIVQVASIQEEANRNGGPQAFILAYELQPDANGVATITVTVDDGSASIGRGTEATVQKTFTITVSPVNDPPVNTTPPSISGTPHVGQTLTAVAGVWNDDKDTVWVPVRIAGITYAYQWQMQDQATRAWTDITGATASTFVPALAQNGKDIRAKVTATDSGTPGTASDVAYSNVLNIGNSAPTFDDGTDTTVYGYEDNENPAPEVRARGFSFTLGTDDADFDTLAWSILTQPENGQATVDQEGNVVYTPDLNYYNTGALERNGESFVVKIDDGLGGTDTITVHAEVAAVNDAPTIGSLQLTAKDAGGATISFSKPEDIAKVVVAVVGLADVDDTVFTYDYVWQIERRDTRGTTETGTDDVNELTLADLGGLAPFQKDDKVRVTVTVTDSGGGQAYDLPANLSATATKQALLGSPPWFPQVPLSSLLADYVAPEGDDEEFYEVTFALNGVKIVAVVVKATSEKETPLPAEYLAAVWPYDVKGFRSALTYTVTRVRKFNTTTGKWDVQTLATNVRVGEPTVTIEDYDLPSIESAQGGVLERVQDEGGDYTGDYRAEFSLDNAGGYLYTWVGPGTDVEELVLFDADPDGTFPTTKDLNLDMGNITQPGTYTLTVTPVNPESQFPAARVADQEVWTLVITQAEIDENNATQTAPEQDDWGMTPGWADADSNDVNDFTRASPEYVGTLAEEQLGLAVTLSWNAIPDTRQYYLLVADSSGVPLREYNRIPVGTLTHVTVFLGAGTYQWRIAGINVAGTREWSPIAWFQIRGLAGGAAALAERYTPFVDGAVGAVVNWGRAASLDLSCSIEVSEAVALTAHVYVTSGARVVYDKWVTLAAARGSVPFAMSLTAADGVNIQANTRYTVSIQPRNRVAEVNYTGPWSDPTTVSSGSGGGLDFAAVTGATVSGGHLVFDFTGSGVVATDVIGYTISITRNGTKILSNSPGQMTGADLVANLLTLPTAVQAGDQYVVRLRVQRDGTWTDWRIFWGTVAADR